MQRLIDYGPLGRLFNTPKPEYLYHYTGPAGVMGILKTKVLWAGRPADMNDSSEQVLARDVARHALALLKFPERSFGEGMIQYAQEELADYRSDGLAVSRAYTVSLTSADDSLEQWRAYCPRSGGVALGFSVEHLQNVAADQMYVLVPCAYDDDQHGAIVNQIVRHHLDIWERRTPLLSPRQGISSHLIRDFIADLDRFAPLLKHASFASEKEWRLISPLTGAPALSGTEFVHIPHPTGIKQFREFALVTPQHPEIPSRRWPPGDGPFSGGQLQGFRPVIGPSIQGNGMEEAIRALTPREFGWVYRVKRTSSPYR